MENLISYYPNGIMLKKGLNNYPAEYLTFDELIEKMRSIKLKQKIERIRNYEYKSYQYNNAKKRLPVALFNKFKYNLNSGIIEENPIKPFDVDFSNNTAAQIKKFRKKIKDFALFVIDSPSGKGIKFFVKSEFKTLDSELYLEKYKKICKKIELKYNINLDYSQGRIKQPFFLTYIH